MPPREALSAAFEVVSVRKIGGSSLQAIATIQIGPLLIHGIRVIQQSGEAAWMGLPLAPIRMNATGRAPVVTIDDPDLFDRIRAAVLDAWQNAR